MLSDEDVERIASAVVEKARADVDVRDVIIGSAMGEGAIPLYGRETRKELCSCCLIDPAEPNAPENRMCTTSGAIGTLKDSEEREWCSEIKIVADGRCARARSIREAAKVCKEKYPEDTTKFFECYAPAFSQITKRSNPGVGAEVVKVSIGDSVCDIYTGACGPIVDIMGDEVKIEPTTRKKVGEEYLEIADPPIRAKKANLVPDHIRRYGAIEAKETSNPGEYEPELGRAVERIAEFARKRK